MFGYTTIVLKGSLHLLHWALVEVQHQKQNACQFLRERLRDCISIIK